MKNGGTKPVKKLKNNSFQRFSTDKGISLIWKCLHSFRTEQSEMQKYNNSSYSRHNQNTLLFSLYKSCLDLQHLLQEIYELMSKNH